MLGDRERAVSFRLDDRIADIGEVGNILPIVETIAARTLRAALDDVAGDDTGSHEVVILRRPSELVAKWRHRKRGVGRSTGDDDVRPFLQRLDDRTGADIRVGRQYAIPNRGQ